MRRSLPLLTALLLLTGTGLAHGLMTGRWFASGELEAAAASVSDVPLTVGDWRGRAEAADEESFQQAGAVNYWTRRYERQGEVLTVILMCGRAGPLSVHTPRDCYGGAGYEMVGDATRQLVEAGPDGETGEFWTARFRKPAVVNARVLRIYWSWKAGQAWQAPDYPRWAFRGKAFLYKLYVIREVPGDQDRPGADAAQTFLHLLLPTLTKSLFSPPAPS